jgi:HlyD family secretion protein
LPKRPKGRWFVVVLLVSICAYAFYTVWTSFFRYQAHGTIEGHLIQVSPPWDGALQYLQVHEGDTVRQGQLLFAVDSIELRHRHAQLQGELRVAQASLAAESAKLKWQSAFNLDQGRGAKAAYYETWGNLLREEAVLDELRTQLRRAERLRPSRAISDQEWDQLRSSIRGQLGKLDKLKEVLAEHKQRAEQADALLKKGPDPSTGLEDTGLDQLRPFAARIEALQGEVSRVQDRLDAGQVRAPANGLVVKVLRFAGERCKQGEPIVSLLEEGSLRVVLYMPQRSSTLLAPGYEVKLTLDPYPQPLPCHVQRLGDQFEPAPEHIKRHYREGQRLLPVHLQPSKEATQWMALRVGGVVKLSYLRPQITEPASE